MNFLHILKKSLSSKDRDAKAELGLFFYIFYQLNGSSIAEKVFKP